MLLRLIRAGDPWLRRSISRHPARQGVYGWIRARLRVFGGLVNAPLYTPRGNRLYLPGNCKANSKSGKILEELKASSFPSNRVYLVSEPGLVAQVARFLARMPWAMLVAWSIGRRARHLDWINIRLILEYLVFSRLFKVRTDLVPVIISDTTPSMFSMWAAAENAGSRTLWWQDDYHHNGPLRFNTTVGVILNAAGLQALRESDMKRLTFLRQSLPVRTIRPMPEQPVVGVATNALFGATPTEMETLGNLRHTLGVAELELRLHPRASRDQVKHSPEWLKLAPESESLEHFASRIDLAVVGNSASQIAFLREGVPVLHVAGLDELEFDFYDYCRQGVCFGVRSSGDFDREALYAFYCGDQPGKMLAAITEFPKGDNMAMLDELSEWLLKASARKGND